MPRYEAFSSRTLKGRAFSLNGNQVPAYCTRALTLAGGTCRVAHAPFDARCVLAGGPATIENVAHAQLDSQEKVLRLARQFFPMRVRALAGSGFRDTSSSERSVRSTDRREHSMTHLPYPAGDDGAAHNANPELRERGSVTRRLRTGSLAPKTDHRQAVEGICGPVGA